MKRLTLNFKKFKKTQTVLFAILAIYLLLLLLAQPVGFNEEIFLLIPSILIVIFVYYFFKFVIWFNSKEYRRFYSVTGICTGILFVLNILLYGSDGIDIVFWLLLGLLLGLIILYLCSKRFENKLHSSLKILINALFLIAFIPVYLLLIIYSVYCIANLPKGKPFEEKVKVSVVSEEEIRAYKKFFEMSHKIDKEITQEERDSIDCLLENTCKDSLKSRQIMNDIYPRFNEILEFAETNIVSPPLEDLKYTSEIPSYSPLISGFKAELFLIQENLSRQEYGRAKQKYYRLWRILNNHFKGNRFFLGHMIGIVLFNILEEFSIKNSSILFIVNNDEVSPLIQNLIENSDINMKNSFFGEYISLKNNFKKTDVLNEVYYGTITYESALIKKRKWKWPFFDYYKTLEILDNYFFISTTQLLQEPFTRVKSTQVFDEYITPRLSFIKNPAGSYILGLFTHNFYNLIENIKIMKSNLLALNYLIESINTQAFITPPIDCLTGKPFIVHSDNDSLSIKSEYDHPDIVNYQIKRSFER